MNEFLQTLREKYGVGMNDAHHEHISRMIKRFAEDWYQKYAKGQEEHGGELWQKGGMLEEAINEIHDLASYLYTLKEQKENQ